MLLQFGSRYPISWFLLTHWGRVMHICVGKLTIIGSDNGLSPGRRQAIIWTNAGISLIGPLATNFNEILIGIQTFSFKKMHLKVLSAKWRPCCLGLNVLTNDHTLFLGAKYQQSSEWDIILSLQNTEWEFPWVWPLTNYHTIVIVTWCDIKMSG